MVQVSKSKLMNCSLADFLKTKDTSGISYEIGHRMKKKETIKQPWPLYKKQNMAFLFSLQK